MDEEFSVKFSYKGRSAAVDVVARETTAADLLSRARALFQVDDDVVLRLLFKGKTIARDGADGASSAERGDRPAFPEGTRVPRGVARVIVMGSAATGIRKLNSLRSDPVMRGFDEERSDRSSAPSALSAYWGPLHGKQDERYKFCRFQECTDASFGSRPGSSTPHAFQARKLLEQLATDPGVVSLMRTRELVVGTLGEMDPIDDRIMLNKQREGGHVLGYNTNRGLRIDVKLRTDDLGSFRPYGELAATLIHELSHNWVGDHDAVFWTNYGQMRVEYLWAHARLMQGGVFVDGKRTAALAGVVGMISPDGEKVAPREIRDGTRTMDEICRAVLKELAGEMKHHRLSAQLVAPALLAFGGELMKETKDDGMIHAGGQRLGAGPSARDSAVSADIPVRERALAAAEKRARQARDKSG